MSAPDSEQTFAISLFDHVKDNVPKPQLRTWDQLLERIAKPLIRVEKDGALFSPATFDPPKRGKKNVVEVSMLVLDYDHHASIDEDCAPWRDLELTFAVYTTHSSYQVTESNPDAEERFRVMIPLLEPIPGDKFPLLWQWAAELTEGKIDAAAKDSSRIFYTPVRCAEHAQYECFVHEGELLDWRALDLKGPEPVTFSEIRKGTNDQHRSQLNEKYLQTAIEQEVGRVATAQMGSCNDQLNKSAFALGQFVGSGLLSEGEVEDALERAAMAAGMHIGSKGGGVPGIRATIRSGLDAGKMEPRGIPEKQKPQRVLKVAPVRVVDDLPEEPDYLDDAFGQETVDSDPKVLPSPPLLWKRTDLGIAEEFIIRHGDRVRRIVDTALRDNQGFVWWTGAYWETGPRAIGQVLKCYHSMVKEAREAVSVIWQQAASKDAMDSNQKDFLTFAKSLESSDRTKSFLIKLGQLEPDSHWLNIEDFDRNTFKLNFQNGTVDLKTGELAPHDPADYITKVIPYPYDPDADRTKWMKFLTAVQPAGEITFLQRWAGYCATGQTSEKKFLVTLGKSSTGKSVFWNVLRAALGPYAQTASVETFEEARRSAQSASEDLAALRGVRLVVLPEPAENYKLSDALIKRVTGGDQIRARFLNQGGFVYLPQFKIVYYTNFSLRFNGADTGMQTRYCELGFNNVIAADDQDDTLTETLISCCLPGIAAWIVEGAREWKANAKTGLSLTAGIKASTSERLSEQDWMGEFIARCFDVAPDFRDKVKDIYSLYLKECAMNGVRNPLSKISLGKKLNDRGFHSEQDVTDRNQYRTGLAIKEEFRIRPDEENEPPY